MRPRKDDEPIQVLQQDVITAAEYKLLIGSYSFVWKMVDENMTPIVIKQANDTLIIFPPEPYGENRRIKQQLVNDKPTFVFLGGEYPIECRSLLITHEEGKTLERVIQARVEFNAAKKN